MDLKRPLPCRIWKAQFTLYIGDLGHANSNGNGLSPVSYQEIKAWSELTGIELNGWEATTLRDLSIAYIIGHSTGRDPASAPFWQSMNFNKDHVAKGMRSMFSSMNQVRKK